MPHRAHSPSPSENELDISTSLFQASHDDKPDHGQTTSSIALPHDGLNLLEQSDLDDEAVIANQLVTSNRKATNLKGRTVKRGGGFQALGLNGNLLKAITRKGFSVPTPIQRKTIPLLLQDQDVVGMARTGSGKTAAFVIPLIEKLKMHSAKVGARAVILSPSRELALQTLQVVKELGRGTDLKCVLLVGGDSLEEQFSSMSSNPDIIIATPGRFLHLKVEMGLDLSSMRYVVFDEADRLFEMGFAAQLTEILHALPASRQTLLFSATLPKSLVEFARAGLQEPLLVRLDADSKISPDLQSAFFTVKSAEKEAALLHILQDIIKVLPRTPVDGRGTGDTESDGKPSRKRKRDESSSGPSIKGSDPHSTIVFASTKHHVEYLTQLLRLCGYAVSHVYGSLDQTARKMQVQSFRSGETNILVVTDVAARGIDIPIIANVINYDFPSQPKIFVHRVGRTARAGQKGWSYSIIRDSDGPYLLDLQLFLSKKLVLGRADSAVANFAEEVVLGSFQREAMERCTEWVNKILEDDADLSALQSVAAKGEKQYQRTRNAASAESAKRARNLLESDGWMSLHPLFNDEAGHRDAEREKMLARVGGFRPPESIFEIGTLAKRKRVNNKLVDSIRRVRKSLNTKKEKSAARSKADNDQSLQGLPPADPNMDSSETSLQIDASEDFESDPNNISLASSSDLEATFSQPMTTKSKPRPTNSTSFRAPTYMSYNPTTQSLTTDAAYGVHSGSAANFASAARSAAMDLHGDEAGKKSGEPHGVMRWDKRHRKYVRRGNDEDGSRGGGRLVRGESGAKIAASFRSGRFERWKRENRVGRLPRVGELERDNGGSGAGGEVKRYRHTKVGKSKPLDRFRGDYEKKRKKERERLKDEAGEGRPAVTGGRPGRGKSEIKGLEAIRKQRREKEKRREKNARPSSKAGTMGKTFKGKGRK